MFGGTHCIYDGTHCIVFEGKPDIFYVWWNTLYVFMFGGTHCMLEW